MKKCPQCGNSIETETRFCQHCGKKQKPPGIFPWRKTVIALLLTFLIAGAAYLIYEGHFKITVSDQNGQEQVEDGYVFDPGLLPREENPLVGVVYGSELTDSWNYPGGVIIEYRAKDEAGNRVTIYKDQDTDATIGFTVSALPATRIGISEQQALQTVEMMASQTVPFYDDPNLQLITRSLTSNIIIDSNPEAGKQYEFIWQAIDRNSGAFLLRSIEATVHAETGRIIHFGYHDRGVVAISTQPDITGDEAVEIALQRAERTLFEPKEVGRKLFVASDRLGQNLVWEIIIEENASKEAIQVLWIYVDAVNGRVLNTAR